MHNIRVEYTHDGEQIMIDRVVSDKNDIQKTFDDIGQLIGLPSKGLRQEVESIYDGVEINYESSDDQFTFQFDEEGDGQKMSPFEYVVQDQVSWNEKYPNSLNATWPFPNDRPSEGQLSEDVDISDRPSQSTLRVDSDKSDGFYYNGT